jgi:Spy/CpxP family protein refolding chaperone
MKTKNPLAAALLLCSPLMAQVTQPGPPAAGLTTQGKVKIVYRGEMGKWWQNSDIAKKLQLSPAQTSQLDQVFYDHKLKLIDFAADMEKQDLKLQTLLDADVPNEGQIDSQVDQVLSARGKLEREYTMMNLDLRKVLSLEQWRQLKSLREQHGGFGDTVFFRKFSAPGAPPGAPVTMPPPPGAPPLPAPDDLF